MKKPSSLKIAIVGSILTEGAFLYFAMRTGFSLQPVIGLGVIFFLLLIFVVLSGVLKRSKLSANLQTGILICFWLLPVVWQMTGGYIAGTSKGMFERLVTRPMPDSVKNFAWQGGVGIDGAYNFAFQMDANDTKKLIQTLNLEPNTNSEHIDRLDKEYLAEKFSWVKEPHDNIDSPISFERKFPWRIELITDTNYHQIYIFR